MIVKKKMPRVAYFCMEYGLHEEFKIYAGGLGILAGDHMKSAKDGEYPLVGIGLLWRAGYTSQRIGPDGKPYDCYPWYEYDFLKETGITVTVRIRGRKIKCKVWLVDKYGNAPLYLLDTNVPGNPDPLITGQLYGWFGEERVAQEMVLGIGGIRALRELGIEVDTYHFNEGHAALAGMELIREKMDEEDMTFEEAWAKTREEIVFTTHTPIPEGNEAHDHELLKYLGAYNGLTHGQMLRIGGEPFNMTVAGLRLSRIANGVAQLHKETAKNMWKDVDNASEILGITNGVHPGTWQDERIMQAYRKGEDLWEAHTAVKKELIEEVHHRTGVKLDADAMLIGFARRAAAYKRSDLIFAKPDVIGSYFETGKLQIIFSGKAHPNDPVGKKIVSNLIAASKQYPNSVVFLEDYDMKIGRLLTRGCDIWLNNPIRPLEASGTSGMKAAMNGVLNCSILDGWWPEGCAHGVNGWKIGEEQPREDQDEFDVDSLYKVLLEEILPLYENGRSSWVKMMKESIKMSHWQFSSDRMLEEYFDLMYAKEEE